MRICSSTCALFSFTGLSVNLACTSSPEAFDTYTVLARQSNECCALWYDISATPRSRLLGKSSSLCLSSAQTRYIPSQLNSNLSNPSFLPSQLLQGRTMSSHAPQALASSSSILSMAIKSACWDGCNGVSRLGCHCISWETFLPQGSARCHLEDRVAWHAREGNFGRDIRVSSLHILSRC